MNPSGIAGGTTHARLDPVPGQGFCAFSKGVQDGVVCEGDLVTHGDVADGVDTDGEGNGVPVEGGIG